MKTMVDKVAVVTGSNKGIGFGIVQELCKRGVKIVYLTARDVSRGLDACDKLKKEGLNPYFHQLDVADRNSVAGFADHLKKKHGGIDILFNNAGVLTKSFTETTYEDSKHVININYRCQLTIQEFLFPILNDNARVINISSECGHICNLKNPYWIRELTKPDVMIEDITAFVDWFLESVKNNTLKEEDFIELPFVAYRVSKIALCALTRVQQREIGRGISVNCLNPGRVKTDMTRNYGEMTVEESQKTPVYLALDIDQSVKGKFFWFDRSEKDWADTSLDDICYKSGK